MLPPIIINIPATLADTPEIEVINLQGSSEPLGVVEPPIEPIAPAIAAAVFDLTGQNHSLCH
ncbi:hypothetical protein [Dyadobacter frigoris]|uniref:hypothetical protein n=1 Tax=Dyadobacter frigoris TaxID=2576211 RepID=UPI0025539A53|nr:hypothetical protein [Dyadobacter frigoris]